MVKKAKWLKNVKKAFSAESKKLKYQSVECENGVISYPVLVETTRSSPPQFEVRVDEINFEQYTNHCSSSSDSVTATDADAPGDSPSSAPELVTHRAAADRFPGKSKEEAAAILIQTAFRGYLARKELRAMRGVARLNLLMEGSVVKRQAAHTLKCMQTLSRVQSQIRARRIRMTEENHARHKQLLQKHAKELGGLKNGDNWDDSSQSKKQVETSLLNRYEATMRRERALAYAYTHQQNLKSGSRTANPMFMDPSNPTWGWSWLERWMAGRPWECSEKEQNKENSMIKSSTNRNNAHGGEPTKSSSRNQLNSSTRPKTSSSSTRNPRKISNMSPSRPIPSSRKSKTIPSPSIPDDNTKSNRRQSSSRPTTSPSVPMPHEKNRRCSTAKTTASPSVSEDEAKCTTSTLSEKKRRHIKTTTSPSISEDEGKSTVSMPWKNRKQSISKTTGIPSVPEDEAKGTVSIPREKNRRCSTAKTTASPSVSDDEAKSTVRRHNISKTAPEDDTRSTGSLTEKNRRLSNSKATTSPSIPEEDAKVTDSTLPEKNRRHSPASSSVRDDESLASSTARLVPAESVRGKVKAQSLQSAASTVTTKENSVVPDKAPAKKRLSSASPAPKPRRFSAPPKVEDGNGGDRAAVTS